MGAIVWLASYPKSGNTWTRVFLHNLLRAKDTGFDINEMNELTTAAGAKQWYQPLLPRPLEDCSLEEVAAVRAQAQASLAAEAPGLVFVKTHNAMVVDFGHSSINKSVTAGAVYILRNPLDVAHSYAHHLGQTIDDTIALLNKDFACTKNSDKQAYEPMGSWRQHVESWTHKPHQALHIMRYEDMLERAEETFAKLCTFLRIKPRPGELAGALAKSSFEALQAQEERKGFRERVKGERFFRQGRAHAWRDQLDEDQIKRIVEANRDMMARWGYLPEGY